MEVIHILLVKIESDFSEDDDSVQDPDFVLSGNSEDDTLITVETSIVWNKKGARNTIWIFQVDFDWNASQSNCWKNNTL